jgi:hypothetical protein
MEKEIIEKIAMSAVSLLIPYLKEVKTSLAKKIGEELGKKITDTAWMKILQKNFQFSLKMQQMQR